MVRRVSGQGIGGPTFRVGVECGTCVERCPFDVEIVAKMHEAAALSEERAAYQGHGAEIRPSLA